ncbi:MAG: type II toxin-antitoxin system PemK/MazF family toxin, partial [Anaerolineae bacterium]|nr:type II toxin-antitoxin system PemK/MazF family toxin [Anaerolineae bacterium]
VGEEIRKTRPAVVVSPRGVGRPKLFIVVPLTTKSESTMGCSNYQDREEWSTRDLMG